MNKFFFSPGALATLVCSLEVAAPKPGNVHRGADFHDLTLEDFLVSGSLLGQVIDQFGPASVGETILQAVRQTKALVRSNTNLGIVLLLVPLAKTIQWHVPGTRREHQFHPQSPAPQTLCPQLVQQVLAGLNCQDTESIYVAIREANAGGLSRVDQADLYSPMPPEITPVEAMSLAAERDLIARQYTNQFQEVFGLGIDLLARGRQIFPKLSEVIVFTHVGMMAQNPDSLIARKCGWPEAQQSQAMAAAAFNSLNNSQTGGPSDWSKVAELDFWLRAKGNQRNPGTTADLVTASLFVAIYNGIIQAPFH